jgi:hypothetical protein
MKETGVTYIELVKRLEKHGVKSLSTMTPLPALGNVLAS